MNQANFEKITDMVKKFQEPLQQMAELNIKTLQNINYLKPEELTSLKKPEDLLEKQIDLAVENGHKALEYMQKSFEIFEKTMLTFAQETKKATAEKK